MRAFDKLLFTRHRTGPIENRCLNAADFAPGLKQQLTVKAQQLGPSSRQATGERFRPGCL
ncbi:protein of unknown function (plasmid) [Cupriavidus taiwanensis]|uniref:Uncharacterized protein n=1 Tax=Cupriavidus taiwanensis TaxID=164546 RepID=A0A375HEU9_9BURK|nr:protein of unknown function [Cupriavidus taiwanensis]SOZ72482.1 protein of unknown function [Cupriavidus taiwanensis]SOZ74913.1 protein of unknown function [Cupriavidus taiwanensis]SPA03346.1 protein of unknown function [Cupriavidus taiwanensis]SPA11711.1 protein of unknown function [Cupriavidus taiwanensis]